MTWSPPLTADAAIDDRLPVLDSDVARWVREARHGAQPAFARLYRHFMPLVHGILLGRHPHRLVDELAQECFATAFARLAQLQQEERFGPWVATIARRMRPATPMHDDGADLATLADSDLPPEDRLEAARVLRVIATLPEAYREPLLLRLAEGLSGPEIAALTGMTHGSVRVNLHRGMQKLREALGLAPDLAEAGHD